MSTYVAICRIERRIKGKPEITNAGETLELNEGEAEELLNLGAIREIDIEEVAVAAPKVPKGRKGRKVAAEEGDNVDESAKAEDGNEDIL